MHHLLENLAELLHLNTRRTPQSFSLKVICELNTSPSAQQLYLNRFHYINVQELHKHVSYTNLWKTLKP